MAGWRDITVTRPDNTTFSAAVYYPALGAGGSGAALDSSAAPYAAISFGHGFVTQVEKYQSTLSHLATWGFVVIASRSGGNLFPSHQAFANDLSTCLTQLQTETANPASWLFQAIDPTRFGMSGHSMGGGCSILATAADDRVQVLANLAAAETNPSAILAMAEVGVPAFLICGSDDSIVPVSTNGQRMYNAGNPPLQLPLIIGGYHCGFIDADMVACDSGSLPREQQLALTHRLLAEIFGLYLQNDQRAARLTWGPESLADPNLQVQADAGITLSPTTQSATACPGFAAVPTVTLTNTGAELTSYSVFIEDNTWAAQPVPAQTPVMLPGDQRTVSAIITTPLGPGPTSDSMLLSIQSDLDHGTRVYAYVAAQRQSVSGDLDFSGVIDLSDLTVLLSNYGRGGATPEQGDLDGNLIVDLSDLVLLLAHYGEYC